MNSWVFLLAHSFEYYLSKVHKISLFKYKQLLEVKSTYYLEYSDRYSDKIYWWITILKIKNHEEFLNS